MMKDEDGTRTVTWNVYTVQLDQQSMLNGVETVTLMKGQEAEMEVAELEML